MVIMNLKQDYKRYNHATYLSVHKSVVEHFLYQHLLQTTIQISPVLFLLYQGDCCATSLKFSRTYRTLRFEKKDVGIEMGPKLSTQNALFSQIQSNKHCPFVYYDFPLLLNVHYVLYVNKQRIQPRHEQQNYNELLQIFNHTKYYNAKHNICL